MIATDIKTKIPEGWNQIQFGQLFVERKKSRLKVEEAFLGGQYPFFTSGEKVLSRNDYLSDGSHLFLATGGVANAKFFNGKASYSSDTYCIAGKDENTKLLFYTIWNNLSYINYHFFEGSGLKHLQKSDFKKFKILFPENPKEQQKIAEVLTTIDDVIEKTDAIIEKNKRIKQGLMQDLFRYGIDENVQIRSEKTHKFKTVKIGNEEMQIPEEWEIKTIIEIANNEKFAIVDGPFGSNLKTEHYKSSGIPIIQSGFVTSGEFYAEKYLYVDKQKFLSEIRSKVIPGDIVMAKIGAQCGTSAILPENHPVSILAGNCLKISVGKNYSNIFLDTLLKYSYQNGRLFLIITTTAQPAVNMSALKDLPIIKPPIKEQERIVELLNLRNLSIKKEETYKQKLLSLKRGLMEDLLTGKVRVNSLIN